MRPAGALGPGEVERIDAADLPLFHNGRESPLYWGLWCLIAIEVVVFGSLLSSYLYFGVVAVEWPPGGVDDPELLIPTINTVILLGTVPCTYLADRKIRGGNQRALAIALAISLALAAAFVVLKLHEFTGLPYRWDSHAYGSIVWATTAFHFAHVCVIFLKTIVVEVLAVRGYFTADRNLGVQVNGLYWYFVVVVWLPIYAIIYLSPRLTG